MRPKTLFVAIILLMTACAGDPDTTTTVGEIATTTPDEVSDLEPCPSEAGDVITETMVTNGCSEDGGAVLLGVTECGDGRMLWAEGSLWGFVGEPIVETAGDAAADPDFAAAFEACG